MHAQPASAKVPAEVMERLLVRRVEPVYPEAARRANLQGVVVLDAIIAADGTVVNIRPVSGADALVSAAMDAARWWRFRPYRVQGEPAPVETTLSVEFRLYGPAELATLVTHYGEGPRRRDWEGHDFSSCGKTRKCPPPLWKSGPSGPRRRRMLCAGFSPRGRFILCRFRVFVPMSGWVRIAWEGTCPKQKYPKRKKLEARRRIPQR